jgi:hypothetical protein
MPVSHGASSAPACRGSPVALLQLERAKSLTRGLDLAVLASFTRCRALVVTTEQQHDLLAVRVTEDSKQHLAALARALNACLAPDD